jgi:hypothetical protein
MKFKIIKMIYTDLIIQKMCLLNSWKYPVDPQGSAEHSLETTVLMLYFKALS